MNYSELIAELSKILRTSRPEVERIIISAPYRYKHYTIPKRKGGSRDIHHPTPALKLIQRWIVDAPLANLPVHDSVYSYRHGKNIAMHAAAHRSSNAIVRFDFADFFPSIKSNVLKKFLTEEALKGTVGLDRQSIDAVVRLCCCFRKSAGSYELSIGAPSSPLISNAILFDFDVEMSEVSRSLGGIYTRYADDVYLSARSKETSAILERAFVDLVARRLPFLRLNEAKTQRFSRKRRMSVTGLNITPQRKISIGRDLKRSLRTKVFLALNGNLDPAELPRLKGMLSHVKSVEPSFIERLERKFGVLEIARLLT